MRKLLTTLMLFCSILAWGQTIEELKQKAEAGDAKAQYDLGLKYWNADGVEMDYNETEKWLRKSAEQGYAKAQHYWGVYLAYVKPKDFKEALLWYHKAAEQGHAEAQCAIGVCYYNGNGVDKDYSKALEWLMKAAEQGHDGALYNVGYCYEKGNGVDQDLNKALEYYIKADQNGHKKAKGDISRLNNLIDEANKILAKAEAGDAISQYRVGLYFKSGNYGLPKNQQKAFEWFKKSAVNGHAEGMDEVGDCYHSGEGIEKNEAEAVRWWKKAAANGHSPAMFGLGLHLKDVNTDEAIYWFKKEMDAWYAEYKEVDDMAKKELLELGVSYDPQKEKTKDNPKYSIGKIDKNSTYKKESSNSDLFWDYLKKGDDAFDAKKFGKAVKYYSKAYPLRKCIISCYDLAISYFNNGKYKKALEYYNELLTYNLTDDLKSEANDMVNKCQRLIAERSERREQFWTGILTGIGEGLAQAATANPYAYNMPGTSTPGGYIPAPPNNGASLLIGAEARAKEQVEEWKRQFVAKFRTDFKRIYGREPTEDEINTAYYKALETFNAMNSSGGLNGGNTDVNVGTSGGSSTSSSYSSSSSPKKCTHCSNGKVYQRGGAPTFGLPDANKQRCSVCGEMMTSSTMHTHCTYCGGTGYQR